MGQEGHVFQPRSAVFLDHVFRNAHAELQSACHDLHTIMAEMKLLHGQVITTPEQEETVMKTVSEFVSVGLMLNEALHRYRLSREA